MSPGSILCALFLVAPGAAADAAKTSESILKESGVEMALGDLEAARLLATQAIEFDTANPRGYLQRAVVELQLKAFDASVKDATRAVSLGFHKASVFNVRSEAYAGEGLYQRAFADAEIAVAANPASGAGFLNRALARQGLEGLGEDALADFRRAAELDSRYKPQSDAAAARLAKPKAAATDAASPPALPARLNGKIRWGAGAAASAVFLIVLAMDWRRRRSRRVRFGSVISLPPEVDEPRPGAVLSGRFIVGRKLSPEFGAEVFEGRDLSDSPRLLRRYPLPRETVRRSLALARASAVAALKHPCVEGVDAVFEESGGLFAACRPLSGQPLHGLTARLAGRRLPAEQALRVFKGICDALEAAHAKPLAHGGLTAACIYVERAQVVVADFVAPRVDAKPEDDLFALGCCLYETLAGQAPFPGPDAELQKREGRFAPPSTIFAAGPAGLDGFFVRALNPEPAQRFRAPQEFFLAFRGLVVPLVQ